MPQYILVYSSNEDKLAEILKENDKQGIVVPVPKVKKKLSWIK